jgi:XTP/dITP diphosphohydrolase
MPLVVLATRNRKKRQEIAEVLAGLPVTLGDLADFPAAPEVAETAGTFEGNAALKAVGVARALGHWTLSDDSGLVVPALGGEPGVDSALYAGRHGDDAANNAKLTAELRARGLERAPAYYVCVIAIADPAGQLRASVEGRCHGYVLATGACGAGGFGYDPHFLVPEYHTTFGELSAVVKHAISHRARALGRLRPVLQRLLMDI